MGCFKLPLPLLFSARRELETPDETLMQTGLDFLPHAAGGSSGTATQPSASHLTRLPK